jgi:hypothetical protein
MSELPQQHKIFKAILRAIVADDFRPEDYHAALKQIRDGSLVALLEQIVGALVGPTDMAKRGGAPADPGKPPKRKDVPSAKSADELFHDVKRRKITRDQLETILRSIDSGFGSQIGSAETMRNLLKNYRSHATDREWKMLGSIVNGNFENDPYLASISEDYGR